MKTRRRTCIRPRAKRRPLALSPVHLNTVRGTVAATAARFGTRLAPECVEDAMQETFLNLWRARSERMLDCMPYLRRAAANTAIDLLRRQGAKKRSQHLAQTFDLVRAIWQPPRTPEETLIERQEAHQLLAESPALRKRVERLMRQYARAVGMTASLQPRKEIANVQATDD